MQQTPWSEISIYTTIANLPRTVSLSNYDTVYWATSSGTKVPTIVTKVKVAT